MKQFVFHGSATVGEKGQIVIPAEARSEYAIEKGEKLLVFGIGDKGILVVKPSQLEVITKELMDKLSLFNGAIAKK